MSVLKTFLRFSVLYIQIYVSITYFVTNILVQIHNGAIGFVGFFWLIQILGLIVNIIIVWKYEHPLMVIIGPIYLLLYGYTLTRLLVSGFWYLMPPIFILHVIFYGILLLNFFSFIINGIKNKPLNKWLQLWSNVKNRININLKNMMVCIGIVFYFIMLSWSYFGFSSYIKIEDNGSNNDIQINFYGFPFGDFNLTYYDSIEGQKELQYYKEWNSSFYIGITNITLTNPELLEDYINFIHKMQENEIEIIIDIIPVNTFMDPSNSKADFVTYHYTREINQTIELVINWIKSENLTNIRGISMDVEGPKYPYDNYGNKQICNFQKWKDGVNSFQKILNKFKDEFPTKQTFLIAIDGIIFDFYDGDYDLDIIQNTASNPPEWDFYGYMTYEINSPRGNYWFYYKLLNGIERHGNKFIPWIGWVGDPELFSRELEAYQSTLEQFKIVKSLGLKEVVFAPSRNFLGNFSDYKNRDQIVQTMFSRLDDLNSIRNSTFTSFEFPIHQDSRLYKNFNLYLQKWTPYTFISNSSVWEDLMLEMYRGWLMWVEIIAAMIFYSSLILWIKLKRKRS